MVNMNGIKPGPENHRSSRTTNLAINILLASLCAISYIFLIVLFLTEGMNLASFRLTNQGTVSPTTVIPVFVIILTGATSALLTRSVEHDLWKTLFSVTDSADGECHFTESRRKAQWTVSPFGRLLYTFRGRSWILRLSGLLLFGTALLNPVLLYGVRPQDVSDTVDEPPSETPFQGFAPSANSLLQQDGKCTLSKKYKKMNA